MRVFLTENDWNMDETGQFWKALSTKSLSVQSEQGKQCRGGKRAKQQCTWGFFVNASSGKDEPVIVGHNATARFFTQLNDKTRQFSGHYFSITKPG